MATPKENWPIRWEYDLHERDFIARSHPLPVPSTGIFDETVHCALINVQWLPHIIGALQILVEGDSWSGGDEEIFRAQQEIQKLISALSQPCSDGENMLIPEFRSIAIDSQCDQNQWKYTSEPDTAWRNLGTPLCDGDDGDDGEPGEQGIPGETGSPGTPGEDCDCGDPVPTQPPITVGDDRCQQACNIAFGMGSWMHGFFNDTLLEAKATIDAGNILADAVGDIIDAFPILGAVVDTIQDFLVNVIASGASETIAANGEYFKEMIQCELYRIMSNDTEDFTADYLNDVRVELQSWGAALPPQTALLVVIGQIFAVWLGAVPTNELLRRANVYKNSESNCDICDVDCSNGCGALMTHNFVQDPAIENFGWSLVATGFPHTWSCGAANFNVVGTATWSGSRNTNGWTVEFLPLAMGITRNFGASFSLCNVHVTIGNTTGHSNSRLGVIWVKLASSGAWESLHCQRRAIGDTSSPSLAWEGTVREITDMIIVVAVGGGEMTISEVKLNQ